MVTSGLFGDAHGIGLAQPITRGLNYPFGTAANDTQVFWTERGEATWENPTNRNAGNIWAANLDGSNAKRITSDGLSAFPVWGDGGIAFTHFPGGFAVADCGAAGIGTIDPDGSNRRIVIARAPETLTLNGFYGLQPLGWLDDGKLLIGLRSDAGTEGAVLDLGTRKLRRLHEMADQASSDGGFSLGSGGDSGNAVTIVRVSDGKRVFQRKDVCCPDWNR
jgi:hypothetical protein